MNLHRTLRTGALALLVLATACSTIDKNVAKPHSEALAPAHDTPTAQYVESEQNKHEVNQSGFRLLTLSTNALMSRVTLADHAEHSIDLQYFIFEDDDTGHLIAQSLFKAADRGVRVRLLVDDVQHDAADRAMFDALDAHPNIEVRLFNPFNSHGAGIVSKAAQMLIEFRRLNRRMHNKSFIVDNKIAIVGGRNIADGYFDANEKNNYRDLDLLAIGPVVQEASKSFDSYWNNEVSVPVKAFRDAGDKPIDVAKVRADIDQHVRKFGDSDYAQAVIQELPAGATADREGQWFWGSAVLVADQPEKVVVEEDQPSLRIGPGVKALINGAKSELLLMSPYFVPSKQDQSDFIALAQRGVATRVLTNSLASTDQIAVHSAYGPLRRDLISGGVELYELKPVAGVKQTSAQWRNSSGVSLHAKSFVVDSRYVFVGSMNMDQRSKLLNTEMGLIVDSPALAKAVAQFFATITLPANAYRLGLEGKDGAAGGDGQLIWITEEDGKKVIITHEPEAGAGRRVEVMLFKLLPIDGLL